jgi:hypothetical protein
MRCFPHAEKNSEVGVSVVYVSLYLHACLLNSTNFIGFQYSKGGSILAGKSFVYISQVYKYYMGCFLLTSAYTSIIEL